MLNIPGEPLWALPQRPLRLPGVPRGIDPVWATTKRLAAFCAAVGVLWWLGAWVSADPMPECLGVPASAEYHGWDGNWVYEGRVIGNSVTEATCIRPN